MILEVDLGGLKLSNPVMTASGTSGHGTELSDFMDISKLGAFVTKGISLHHKEGNCPPRICETSSGMINAIGLENPGVENFLKNEFVKLQNVGCSVVINFYGKTKDEYIQLSEILGSLNGVDALEMNISCPNVDMGGLSFGTDPSFVQSLVKECRKKIKIPLIIKLAPLVTDIVSIATAAANGGADSITCANTWPATDIDVRTGKFKTSPGRGGLSGPAILPLTLLKVYELWQFFKGTFPIIASGGIFSGEDALKYIIAGASAVQIGTATFQNPSASVKILEEIMLLLEQLNVENINHLTGTVKLP
ncbi:MAG: dihydroorotate dehydrogenase [Deltaproteobacteria bacterium]|nr:dihydroorotate dehydrogenase [Deltaproteobacteria bacterium]